MIFNQQGIRRVEEETLKILTLVTIGFWLIKSSYSNPINPIFPLKESSDESFYDLKSNSLAYSNDFIFHEPSNSMEEFDSLELEEAEAEKSRLKRYPIHLDPNFGSAIRFQPGECPHSSDGHPRFYCPFPSPISGRWTCLEEWELCDGMKHCPDASDENPSNCLFYKVMQFQLQSLITIQRQSKEEDEERRRKEHIHMLENTKRFHNYNF